MSKLKHILLHMLLVILLVTGVIPPGIASADPVIMGNMTFNNVIVTEPDTSAVGGVLYRIISPGETGISYKASSVEMDFDSSINLMSTNSLAGIKVLANGSIDETYKFNIAYAAGKLTLSLKNISSTGSADYANPYQLIKHALYNIYIPQNTFSRTDTTVTPNTTVYNTAVNYPFVTDTDTISYSYAHDILSQVTPTDGQPAVDYNTGKIVFTFIDDILMNATVTNNIANYINIACAPFGSAPYVNNNGDTVSNSISNYNVTVTGNTLVLQAKSGKLNDFAHYSVTLLPNTVYLKNSPDVVIGNSIRTVSFDTNQMLASTSPQNGQTGIGLKPAVSIQFRYPISCDLSTIGSQISVTSGSTIAAVSNLQLSGDGTTLSFNLYGGSSYEPLIPNSSYQVALNIGAVKFTGYPSITNQNISFSFTTTGNGQSPVVTKVSSNQSGTDDITDLASTQLDSGGSIYVFFDRSIQVDPQMSLLSAAALYKMPKAFGIAYDPLGKAFDQTVDYSVYSNASSSTIVPFNISDPTDLENITKLEPIPVSDVEIIQPNILKITPSYPLYNLNKYKLTIDNRAIDDAYGVNVEQPLAVTFWTKASTASDVPALEGLTGNGAQTIQQNSGVSYSSFTLYGVATKFDSGKPITIDINKEVIVKAQDTVQQIPVKTTTINYGALKSITLLDAYNQDTTSNQIGFSKYELFYHYDNGVKKTQIRLYPSKALDSGKYYKLNIPSGVFQTRSKTDLGQIEVDFYKNGDASTSNRGVYNIPDNSINQIDLAGNGEASFTITGYNFIDNIEYVRLQAKTTTVTIPQSDILFDNTTQLTVKIRGDNATTLSYSGYAGAYTVYVKFNDGSGEIQCPVALNINAKGTPEVKALYPNSSDGTWFDENSLNVKTINGTKRYFLKVTFKDPDGTLLLNGLTKNPDGTLALNSTTALSTLRDNCNVYAQGSSASMIDSDFLNSIINLTDTSTQLSNISQYIFNSDSSVKEAYLYIPVKLLRPQTTYNVSVAAGLVCYDADASGTYNGTITWSFTTMANPYVKSISIGSVGEDYDSDVPLKLTGDFFYSSSITVFFNDTEAGDANVKTDSSGNKYLEVYLPDGSDRLEPGTYNITIQNNSSHQRIYYGSFSVVKSGDYVPSEDSRIKDENSKGTVVSDLKVSQDTIELKSKYNDDSHISLDLDDLMGTEVLVRRIKISGRIGHRIGQLETKSQWCDISVYGLTEGIESTDDIVLSLGRLEPERVQVLKTKLKGRGVKSDFIQVSGSNFRIDKAILSIPFKNTDGSNIKVMRYDEAQRSWSEQTFTVDIVNKMVTVNSYMPGIFVVVE